MGGGGQKERRRDRERYILRFGGRVIERERERERDGGEGVGTEKILK